MVRRDQQSQAGLLISWG